MCERLKFYGWGVENTGLDEAERDRLFRFLAQRLGVKPGRPALPQIAEISLREPRLTPPGALAHMFSCEPYERLVHTYGKSYPETVRAYARDFAWGRMADRIAGLYDELIPAVAHRDCPCVV